MQIGVRGFFFCVDLENEGYLECKALISVLDQGKTNQFGRIKFGACIRNKKVRVCTIGAYALYLFYRFHIENEPFPDVSNPRNWYNIKVVKASNKDRTKELTNLQRPLQHCGRSISCCWISQ